MRRVLILIGAATLVASLVTPAASTANKAAQQGRWSKPFAELPKFAKRPPKNVKESLKIPPAVSMAMLPNGRVVYWGGLEGNRERHRSGRR